MSPGRWTRRLAIVFLAALARGRSRPVPRGPPTRPRWTRTPRPSRSTASRSTTRTRRGCSPPRSPATASSGTPRPATAAPSSRSRRCWPGPSTTGATTSIPTATTTTTPPTASDYRVPGRCRPLHRGGDRLLQGHQGHPRDAPVEPGDHVDLPPRRDEHDDARRLRDRQDEGRGGMPGPAPASTSAISARRGTATSTPSRRGSGARSQPGVDVGQAYDIARLGAFNVGFGANWYGSYSWTGRAGPLQHLPPVPVR